MTALQSLEQVQVHEVASVRDARRCWNVFSELRTNLVDQQTFVKRWKTQAAEGYQIAFIEEDGSVVAAAGYRLVNTMAWGRILYLDDLIALPSHRGRGFGTRLIQWVQQESQRLNCDEVHLDTGHHRTEAHRCYLRNGFDITCHHLAWKAARQP